MEDTSTTTIDVDDYIMEIVQKRSDAAREEFAKAKTTASRGAARPGAVAVSEETEGGGEEERLAKVKGSEDVMKKAKNTEKKRARQSMGGAARPGAVSVTPNEAEMHHRMSTRGSTASAAARPRTLGGLSRTQAALDEKIRACSGHNRNSMASRTSMASSASTAHRSSDIDPYFLRRPAAADSSARSCPVCHTSHRTGTSPTRVHHRIIISGAGGICFFGTTSDQTRTFWQ